MYAVVDIETTGGNARYGKITEIAIFVFDGLSIVDSYETLINPEQPIPPGITQLTGITNEMVAEAPKFYEVAKDIVEHTEGQIFVAHNSAFDYGFLQAEFERLGYPFKRQTLCTVKLARKALPGHASYSLGKLTRALGISLNNHHRAAADARATVEVLRQSLNAPQGTEYAEQIIRGITPKAKKKAHNPLPEGKLESLPSSAGVYYFYDAEGQVVYVGKSVNIKQRVLSHLNEKKGRKAADLQRVIRDVSWETTGSELVALLLESNEIKKLQPRFNVLQRRASYGYAIYSELLLDGYIRMMVGKRQKGKEPLAVFSSEREAQKVLEKLTQHYQLCQKLNHLDPYQKEGNRPCWHYNLKQCAGACIGEEPSILYNQRAQEAVQSLQYGVTDFLIIDAGRHDGERSVVHIEKGRYTGFGFAELDQIGANVDLLKDCTSEYEDNRDIVRIIKGYLKSHQVEQIINL